MDYKIKENPDGSFYMDLSHAVTIPYKKKYALFHFISLFFISISLTSALFASVTYLKASKSSQSTQMQAQAQVRAAETESTYNKQRIGFLPSWSLEQEQDTDTRKFSQIIYFGLGVTEEGKIMKVNSDGASLTEWNYLNSEYFKKIQEKAKQSSTKMVISIKNFDNKSIDNLISNPTATQTFIKEMVSLMKEYKLDGINIDFEYFSDSDFPTSRYLNEFLRKISTAIKKDNPNAILSIDVNAGVVLNDKAYDMVKIGDVLDQIILMGYDYHRAESTTTGPIAPLYAGENEHSVSKSINSLLGRVHREKIILGIPFYGYEWQTQNESFKSRTIPESGAIATYRRVKDLLNNRDDIKVHWDEQSMTVWLSYRQSGAIKEIYYENEESIAKKLEFIGKKNLGGYAIWALGYEGTYNDIWNIFPQK